MRDEQLMASERVAVHELPTPIGFWHWSGKVYGERSQDWLTVQEQGGNVNLALLLHRLEDERRDKVVDKVREALLGDDVMVVLCLQCCLLW